MNNHPSASQVYEELHEQYPSISRATVFRLLDKASHDNRIARLKIAGTDDRFDLNCQEHSHIFCRKCSGVFDVPLDLKENLINRIPETFDFQVEGYEIGFYGVCSACAKK